jgi:erythromycin esterase
MAVFMPEQSSQLTDIAIPIRTTSPDSDINDLIPLKDLIGGAQIVGLGEATHGTHEFFTMKHRLVEFLVREMGFTVFAMEANTPEANRINDYILHGVGGPKELIRGMHFWTWNTQEFFDMIEWMRVYNKSGKKPGPIQFTGFDMQFVDASINIVLKFIKIIDPEYHPTLTSIYDEIITVRDRTTSDPSSYYASIDRLREDSKNVVIHFEKNRNNYIEKSSTKETDWAVHNAKLICQFLQYLPESNQDKKSEYRDSSMADNIKWIRSQYPKEKIILWAHNYHISRTEKSMGALLSLFYGNNYLPIGFCFHDGQYNAKHDGALDILTAAPSYPGCYEWQFLQTEIPQFALDLRKASAQGTDSAWLCQPMYKHDIGAVKQDDDFRLSNISEEFDAIIFIDRATPSTLL